MRESIQRKSTYRQRRGSVLVYSMFLMMLMCGISTLVVDYGKIQMVKSQLQHDADATARGQMEVYLYYGSATAASTTTLLPTLNSVDYKASFLSGTSTPYYGVSNAETTKPTASVTMGYYNTTTKVFAGSSFSGALPACKVIMSRTAATGNPVPLTFPVPSGKSFVTRSIDVWAQAIAVLPAAVTTNFTVNATSDPWLSGMPSGSTASYDDSAPANAPTAYSVTPGSRLQFTSVTGTVNHDPNDTMYGPNGQTSATYWHLKDPPSGAQAQGQGDENNIGDIITPIDSLIGVFLDNNAPSAANAPSVVRNSTTDLADTNGLTDVQKQQPFYIGDGNNNSGSNQTVIVPAGATRLFMGPMDGYEWKNNAGSFTGAFTYQPPIMIVQ